MIRSRGNRFSPGSCPGDVLDQSFDAAGGRAAGASWTGAAGRDDFGTACFLAAGTADAAGAGRDDGNGVFADAARGAAGSGVMMLTGGVEAAVGNSALVGLPIGIVGASTATGPVAAAGAFHDGA